MKSKLKWVSGILGAVLALSLVFGAGVYANEQGWLKFKNEQVSQADDNLEAIMEILRQVNAGKITAEEAELRLNGEVAQLTKDKGNLNNQLTDAQKDVEYLEGLLEGLAGETPGQKINKLKEANDSLRSQNTQLETELQNEKDNNKDLQTSIAGLQEDNNKLQGTIGLRDNEIIGLKNYVADLEEQLANAPEDQTEYVAHLEAELIKANEAVTKHNSNTEEALTEAQGYVDVDQE